MRYRIFSERYNENTVVGSECNAIIFINRGDEAVTINGESLPSGEMLINNGLEGEMDVTEYNLVFSSTDANPVVFVRKKKYQSGV